MSKEYSRTGLDDELKVTLAILLLQITFDNDAFPHGVFTRDAFAQFFSAHCVDRIAAILDRFAKSRITLDDFNCA